VAGISRNAIKVFTLVCSGSNDGEEGAVTSFQLESVPLGTDSEGKITTAPVVVQVDTMKTEGSREILTMLRR
jgi:hypothetical protein